MKSDKCTKFICLNIDIYSLFLQNAQHKSLNSLNSVYSNWTVADMLCCRLLTTLQASHLVDSNNFQQSRLGGVFREFQILGGLRQQSDSV